MSHLTPIALAALCLLTLAASPAPTESTTGLVVSAQRLAAEAGTDILRQGGNAIDAAVAVGYAEAVTNPCCGNIGGGGFLTAHLADGRDIFINFRETAPAAASRDMYLDPNGQPIPGASLHGWKAVAVPGTVLGLDTALVKYGTMSRAAVMTPAIRLANKGFVLTTADADILAKGAPQLRHDPTAASIFLRPDGSALQPGDRLRQPQLAAILQAIADQGPDAFYTGPIPQAVEAAAKGAGGLITAADFAAYRITESAPLTCTYRGYQIESAPPPSSGGTAICETLNILERYNLREFGFHAADTIHFTAEAFRLAFFDRATWLGDPAFVHMPMGLLLSKDYAARLAGTISDQATPSASLGPPVPPPGEHSETSHFSIIDRTGAAAAITYTLNGGFGAGVIAGNTGFLLNDEMDDFAIKPDTPNQFGLIQGHANAIAPNKRPLSSMAPSIVLRNGTVQMVLGSPGGPRIITAVVETIQNTIDYGMTAQEAVDAPRFHLQWQPDILFTEPFALSPDTRALLERMHYQIQDERPSGAVALIVSGALETRTAVTAHPDSIASHPPNPNAYYGANDSRRPGGAALQP